MEKISTEEVMDRLNMFQYTFKKIDKFGQWDLERISAGAGSEFTSTDFKEEYQNYEVHMALAAAEHQIINVQVEVTWIKMRTIVHSLMVHARVSKAYINFALMYTTDHIFGFYRSNI